MSFKPNALSAKCTGFLAIETGHCGVCLHVTAVISWVGCGNGLRLGIFSVNISSDPYPVR